MQIGGNCNNSKNLKINQQQVVKEKTIVFKKQMKRLKGNDLKWFEWPWWFIYHCEQTFEKQSFFSERTILLNEWFY